MINEEIARSMLQEFDGCDSNMPGSSHHPSVWLFGIEPGFSEKDIALEKAILSGLLPSVDRNYSIDTQLGYRFNRSAFKLLAAMDGCDVSNFRQFAAERQPFVRGRPGYFKGNLYPYACNTVHDWPETAIRETGITDKNEYRQWCREKRWPAIKGWIDKYQPRVFIGVGITYRNDFSLAVLGREVEFNVKTITVNSHEKSIYYFVDGERKLVVVPHFSGPHGLNSNRALQEAGGFIGIL